MSTPARVGLLGNPSDGYGGRTLALAVPAFAATVRLTEADGIVIRPHADDEARWSSGRDLIDRIDRFGFGTGVQVLAAAVRTFLDVTDALGRGRPDGFELSYDTTIPRQVGLAGSSALVISGLRCLFGFAEIEVPDEVLASLALRVETEHLGITAGLQDRVVQSMGGLVAMDFSTMETNARFGVAHGRYEAIDPELLPPLFVAHRPASAEPSEVYHSSLRARFDAGDPVVRSTMRELAGLVLEGRAALRWRNHDGFAALVGQNMELRRRLGPLPERQLAMVDLATELGAPATFAGSGGAIVGVMTDAAHGDRLAAAFATQGIEFLAIRS